jgi:NAD(P)-dependent dehydrogenase (short-subunit alcohol dehydrogenase family)
MRLDGKRTIVTGAANGLGAAIAHAFSSQGASVAIADIDAVLAEKVTSAICAGGGTAVAIPLDVVDADAWQEALGEMVQRWGGVDILVNNAAIASGLVRIEDRSPQDWDRMIAINAKGPFLGTRAVVPVMRANGGGVIVNVSSLAGLGQSQIMDPAYACSKAALTMLTKVTAAQHAVDGIRCNSVHPGPIDSDLARSAYTSVEAFALRLSRVPLGRLALLDEVVEAVMFLASDASSYVTGAALPVDGGALIQ